MSKLASTTRVRAISASGPRLLTAASRRRKIELKDDELKLSGVSGTDEAAEVIVRQPAPPYDVPDFAIAPVPAIPTKGRKATFLGSEELPLQASIDAAPEGSILEVPAGRYEESIEVTKTLHLVALGEVTIASDKRRHSVSASSLLVTLSGFRITMDESQAESAIHVVTGQAVFKNCIIQSFHTVAANVDKEGQLFLVKCQVSASKKHALKVNKTAMVVAEDTTFKSESHVAVSVAGESMSRFSGCSGASAERNRPAFAFLQTAQYLFEKATINFPMEVFAQSRHGVFRDCTVEKINVTVAKSGTPYFIGCTFNKTTLICREKCGVRLIRDRFVDHPDQPGLIVMGEATVESNECEFYNSSSPAATVAYQNCSMKMADARFIDLSGVGVLAFGRVELGLDRCGFGNCSNSAICVHSGPQVSISGCLVDHTNGVGVLLKQVERAEITRSKFCNSAYCGMEINGFENCQIDHCIFEGNAQHGLVAIEAKLTVNESDFVRNKMTGLDFRKTQFTITKSVALDNLGGGFAFRSESSGDLNGGGSGTNQQFGLGVFDFGTIIKSEDFKLLENEHLALLATAGANVTMSKTEITGHPGVAVMAEGQQTEVSADSWNVSENIVALQLLDGVRFRLKKSQFRANGLHVEASRKAKINAKETEFATSQTGVGLFITAEATGEFTSCNFSDETKTAIVTDSHLTIADSNVVGCGTCGLFFYGEAEGELTGNTISNNASCGVQVMGGTVILQGNTISDHTVFGVHVQPNARVEDKGNTYSSNYMADVNHEQGTAT